MVNQLLNNKALYVLVKMSDLNCKTLVNDNNIMQMQYL